MRKKLFSILTAAVTAVSLLGSSVSAEIIEEFQEVEVNELLPADKTIWEFEEMTLPELSDEAVKPMAETTVRAEQITAYPGEKEVPFTVKINGTHGAFGIRLIYDEAFQPVLNNSGEPKYKVSSASSFVASQNESLHLLGFGLNSRSNLSENSITSYFNIPENTPAGTYKMSVEIQGLMDADGNDLMFRSLDGHIQVLPKPKASGECGEDGSSLIWRLSEDGVLSISGTGKMRSFASDAEVPWAEYRDSISKAVIANGIENIGSYAFNDCRGLKTAEIPGTVKTIESYAFYGCSMLDLHTLPEGVETIGERTFNQCRNLKYFTLPDTLTEIGDSAFSVTNMETITFGNNLKTIGTMAFWSGKMKEVVLPESLETLGNTAFGYCLSLKSVTLPDSLKTIETAAFMHCEALQEVTIPKGVSFINNDPFEYCFALTDIRVAEDNPYYCAEDGILYTADKTTLIRYPAGKTALSYTVPEHVTSFGYLAFENCSYLTELILTENVLRLSEGNLRACKCLSFITILNPKCAVEYNEITIPDTVVIRGLTDSTAQTYAKKYNRPFKAVDQLGDADCDGDVDKDDAELIQEEYVSLSTNKTSILTKQGRINSDVDHNGHIDAVDSSQVLYYIAHGTFDEPKATTTAATSVNTMPPQTQPQEWTNAPVDDPWYNQSTATTKPRNTLKDTINLTLFVLDTKYFEPIDSSLTVMSASSSDTTVATALITNAGQKLMIQTLAPGTCQVLATLSNGDVYIYNIMVLSAPITAAPPVTTAVTAATRSETAYRTTETVLTTTTTAAATTVTTAAVTTTTAAATTTTAQKPYERGCDDWGFINSRQNLGYRDTRTRSYMYLISEEDLHALMSKLSNTERSKIQNVLNGRTRGSCYGMAVTSVLQYYDIFYPQDMVADADRLTEITENNLNDRTRSAINYYQMLQYTKVISQKIRKTERMGDKEKLSPLIESLRAGKPAVLGYTYDGPQGSGDRYGHAVVAYALKSEAGSLLIQSDKRFLYDTVIRIYDNLTLADSPAYDMYVNTKSWEWCIPMTENKADYEMLAVMNNSKQRKGTISLVCTESELMNYHGLFMDTAQGVDTEPDYDYERACMSFVALNSDFKFGTADDPYDGSFYGAGEDGEIEFSASFLGDEANGEVQATMDSDLGYFIEADEPEAMDLSMEYENCLLYADADTAKRVTVSPRATLECRDSAGKYQLSMVLDEGHHATDWHTLEVSGRDGGTILLTPDAEQGGWILRGDSLNNVSVRVQNDATAADVIFTTNYNKVLIYEIDKNTVGVAVDTDKNGDYETTIAKTGDELPMLRGDADGSGEIDVTDAQIVLAAYTQVLANNPNPLTEAQIKACDIDSNASTDAADAQLILIHYVRNKLANNPTSWEEILKGIG